MNSESDLTYELASTVDAAAINDLLSACGLPTEGITLCIGDCIVARDKANIVGVVAIEVRGRVALFRSLAVAAAHRGRAIGSRLCDRMLNHARRRGVETLFLLTTDADRYFSSRGFVLCQRDNVPREIRSTAQFKSICPKTAVCMARHIRNSPMTTTDN